MTPPARPAGWTVRARRLAPLAILAAGLGLFLALDLQRYVSLTALQENHDALTAYVYDNAALASVLFTFAYAAAVAFSIPGAALLTIAGGLMFGVIWGSVLVVLGATAGAVCIFLAARTALAEPLRRRTGAWLQRLEGGFRRNAFSYLLTLRLVPVVPFWLVNIVPSLLGVPLRIFAVTTFIGIIPGTLVYVSLGNGAGATLAAGGDLNLGIIFAPEVLLPLLGLAALSLVPVVLRRVRGNRDPLAESTSAEET